MQVSAHLYCCGNGRYGEQTIRKVLLLVVHTQRDRSSYGHTRTITVYALTSSNGRVAAAPLRVKRNGQINRCKFFFRCYLASTSILSAIHTGLHDRVVAATARRYSGCYVCSMMLYTHTRGYSMNGLPTNSSRCCSWTPWAHEFETRK
uniref:Uncharacterized protein n=1 Tax=Trichogramma kaykai TaxID=54128 RepID=A0ABD2XK16_9HYME